ncbi:MAG: hypothetical protein M3430_01840 [Acidobacteriota bacterium]|nr:hypothetical protein [Acidobacteriota bacterium]
MNFARAFEMGCGAVTGLLGLTVPFAPSMGDSSAEHFKGAFLFYIGPCLLVAVGTYVHAVKRKKWGVVAMLLGGLPLIVLFFVLLLGPVFYGGVIPGLIALTPSVMAAVSLGAAFIAALRELPD